MATSLEMLITLYDSGILDITYDSTSETFPPRSREAYPTTAIIQGQNITLEQGYELCNKIGWTEINCHPFRIIDKTRKFVKGIKNHIPSEVMRKTTMVGFQNKKAGDSRWEQYGSTVDRISMVNNRRDRGFDITVLYGASGKSWGNSSKYEIFDHKSGNKLANCGSLKQVGTYISGLE